MHWAIGFALGISVGTALLSAGLQSQRQRWLKELERVLAGGELRLLKRDGSAATASELFDQFDRAAGITASAGEKNRRIALGVGVAVAVVTALLVVLVGR